MKVQKYVKNYKGNLQVNLRKNSDVYYTERYALQTKLICYWRIFYKLFCAKKLHFSVQLNTYRTTKRHKS